MAELSIRLRVDPETGRRDIIVDLRSDEDALPHEHEQLHRELVERLIEGGILQAGQEGRLIVERESASSAEELEQVVPEPLDERRSESEGNA